MKTGAFEKTQEDVSGMLLKILEIILDHQRDLKRDRIIKGTDIQTCRAGKLLKTVHQSIAVYEQLSCSFRYIQAVSEKHLDRRECLLVKILRLLFREYLFDKHPAEVLRKLIDQAADSQCAVHMHALSGIEDLADIQCHARFLEGTGDL